MNDSQSTVRLNDQSLERTLEFLLLLHRHPGKQPAYVYLWQKGALSSGHTTAPRTIWYSTSEERADGLPPFPLGVDTYFSVHPCTSIPTINARGDAAPAHRVRGKISDISSVAVIFAEFDAPAHHAAPSRTDLAPPPPPGLPGATPNPHLGSEQKRAMLDVINELDPKPSIVVDSGGGYHCYWLLSTPVAASRSVRALQGAWVSWMATMFGADPASKDLARVLRLPGTYNHKPAYRPATQRQTAASTTSQADPYDPAPAAATSTWIGAPVHFVKFDPTVTYSTTELRAALPQLVGASDPDAFTVSFGADLLSSASASSSSSSAVQIIAVSDVKTYITTLIQRELQKVRRSTEGNRNDNLNKAAFAIGRYVTPADLDVEAVARHLLDATAGLQGPGFTIREAATTISRSLAAGQEDLPVVVFRTPGDIIEDAATTPANDTTTLITLRRELARTLASADSLTRDAWSDAAKDVGLGGKTALSKAMKESRPTDADLRDAFSAQHPNVIYHPALEWMRYSSGAYLPIPEHLIKKWIMEVVDEQDRSTLTAGRVESIAKLVYFTTCRPIEDWDRRDVVVCGNGTLSLGSASTAPPTLSTPPTPSTTATTIKLERHRRDNFCTHSVPYNYPVEDHFAAHCPNFLRAISRLTPQVQGFLQEFVGYCLTRDTRHDVMVWIVGRPGSGKSTIVRGILTAMGSHATMLSLRELNRSRFALNGIVGKTLIYGTDVGTDFADNTDALNSLVSGDPLRIEAKYSNPMEVRPTAKILWAMTKMPSLRDPDDGLFRRVQLITVPPLPFDQADPNLRIAVEREGPGILKWAVQGLLRLRQRGHFAIPNQVRQHTIKYRDDQDKTAHFIADCLCPFAASPTDPTSPAPEPTTSPAAAAQSPPGEPEPTETMEAVVQSIGQPARAPAQASRTPSPAAEVYKAYAIWCKACGYNALGRYKLYDELRRLGVSLDRVTANILTCTTHYLRPRVEWDVVPSHDAVKVTITDNKAGYAVSQSL